MRSLLFYIASSLVILFLTACEGGRRDYSRWANIFPIYGLSLPTIPIITVLCVTLSISALPMSMAVGLEADSARPISVR